MRVHACVCARASPSGACLPDVGLGGEMALHGTIYAGWL